MARHNESEIEKSISSLRTRKKLVKVLPVVMSTIVVLIALVYVIALMYNKYGSFTVSINKYDQLSYGLSLSETKDFAHPTTSLNCRVSEEITNIDGTILDEYDLGAIDGEDNGEDYVCYTFYCKNTGTQAVNYSAGIIINKMTLDIEKAVRVRVISKYNDEPVQSVDYARAAGVEDGVAVPEPGTETFYAKSQVMYKEYSNFKPGDVMKYTIVIWLEGPDPDCVDEIIGGEFKIDMKFSIIGAYEAE